LLKRDAAHGCNRGLISIDDEEFKAALQTLNEELEGLNAKARELEVTIASNVAGLLEA
jgi:type I restriction enzyme M protein